MLRSLSDSELLEELESVAEENVNRHFAVSAEWHPHDYVPWDLGRNFAAMGGSDWSEEQSQLSMATSGEQFGHPVSGTRQPSNTSSQDSTP